MVSKTFDEHIVITPGIRGGRPRIAGHRITVDDIVIWHSTLGYSVEKIADDYNLEFDAVNAALTYYHDHKEEIDVKIKEDNEFAEAMRKEFPSKLNQKLFEKLNEFYAKNEIDPEEKEFLDRARKAYAKRIKGTW
jgi:uncharacterized protein (DUF433 family)